MVPFPVNLSDPSPRFQGNSVIFRPMNALDVLCAQLTRDLFAIAKFLFDTAMWSWPQVDVDFDMLWGEEAALRHCGKFQPSNTSSSSSSYLFAINSKYNIVLRNNNYARLSEKLVLIKLVAFCYVYDDRRREYSKHHHYRLHGKNAVYVLKARQAV